MKKIIVTILAVVYLSASVGATVHLHYCMGKLANWGLGHSDDDTCGKCGMEMGKEKDNGCCKDEHRQLKLDDNHKASPAYILAQLSETIVAHSYIELPVISIPSITEETPLSHAPPRWGDQPVYLLNRVFRI